MANTDWIMPHLLLNATGGILGLPDAAIREARARIAAAIRNSGFEAPFQRITVNLAPAGVRKEGAAFDLPMAVGILGERTSGLKWEWRRISDDNPEQTGRGSICCSGETAPAEKAVCCA